MGYCCLFRVKELGKKRQEENGTEKTASKNFLSIYQTSIDFAVVPVHRKDEGFTKGPKAIKRRRAAPASCAKPKSHWWVSNSTLSSVAEANAYIRSPKICSVVARKLAAFPYFAAEDKIIA